MPLHLQQLLRLQLLQHRELQLQLHQLQQWR
jgi:hypothetical protein